MDDKQPTIRVDGDQPTKEEKPKFLLPVAIDPGGTTGIATRTWLGTTKIYGTCTASSPEELYDFIKTQGFTVVIIENFMAQTIGKYGLHTVRIVGGMYHYAYDKRIPYVLHVPQDRYPFLREAKEILKKRKHVIHEVDALAHLLRWEYDSGQ